MVLRGLTADSERKLVFYAWGKQHLGQQYLPASDTDTAEEMLPDLSGASVGDPLRDSIVSLDAPLLSAQNPTASVGTAITAVSGEHLVEASHEPPFIAGATSAGAVKRSAGNAEYLPRPLAALPDGHHTVEVWCGSEFTIAADEQGHLWATGWNEHGNLGIGTPPRQVVPVLPLPESSESAIGTSSGTNSRR